MLLTKQYCTFMLWGFKCRSVHVFLCQMNHFIYKSFYPFTWTWQEKGAIEKTSTLIKFSECINKLTSQKSKKWNGRHTVFVSLPNSSLCRWWVHLFQDKKVGLALDLFDIIVHLFIWLIEMEVFLFVCFFYTNYHCNLSALFSCSTRGPQVVAREDPVILWRHLLLRSHEQQFK